MKEAGKAEQMGFNAKKSLKKGGAGLAQGLFAAAVPAMLAFLANPEAVAAALESMDNPALAGALGAVVVGLGRAGWNWWKNRDR